MPIHFVCPFGHKLVVPDHRAGKKGRCPECEQRVVIPVPKAEPQGPDGKPLNAGPGEAVQLDPTDVDLLGFDEAGIFDDIVAHAPAARRKKKKDVEAEPEVEEVEAPEDRIVPSDANYDPDLFRNLPDEPNLPRY